MLATFAHTGGITGAEVGIAAATAFLNQKLMNALFGEAAVQEMIDRARERLTTVLDDLLAQEQARFTALVPDAAELRTLGVALRAEVEGVDAGGAGGPGPMDPGPGPRDERVAGRDVGVARRAIEAAADLGPGRDRGRRAWRAPSPSAAATRATCTCWRSRAAPGSASPACSMRSPARP